MNFTCVFSRGNNFTVRTRVTSISPSLFKPSQFITVATTGETVLTCFWVIVWVLDTCTKLNKED